MDVVGALLAALLVAASPAPLPPALPAAVRRFETARPQIDAELGPDLASDLHARLLDDLARERSAAPEGYTAEDWSETVRSVSALDIEAVDELLAGRAPALVPRPGLHETFVRSRRDGTWQPVSIYVPHDLRADRRAPLVVALHGNPQTEAELLGQPYLRRLAERTGTIVVAPYGRGVYDFAEPAASEVYDLVEDVQAALPVDVHRTYLVGYSMGAFTVFKIGPRGGHRWAAAMSISGAVLNSEVRAITIAWPDMPVYVVTGAHDTSIPSKYGEQTASFLASIGLPVTFYEEARGEHMLRTLVPALTQAWNDMHAGVVRPETIPKGSGMRLPQTRPGRTPS
jgi:predicted esterase